MLASSSCSRRLVFAPLPSCVRSCPPPVFSCGLLSFFSPFLRLARRGVLCLLAYALWLSFLSPCSPSVSCPPAFACLPHSLRLSFPRLVPPCLLCPPLIVLFVVLITVLVSSSPLPPFRSCLVIPPLFVCPPRLATSMGGERVGSFLLARSCFRPVFPVVRAAGGVGGMVSACCVRFVASLFVYMNWVLARVSWLLSKESD